MGVTALGLFFLNSSPVTPRWTGGVLFDDTVRQAFRIRSAGGRDVARSLSDVTALSTVFLAIGVDSVVTPLARGSSDVAYQMLLLDAEAITLSTLISTATFDVVGRARPAYASCEKDSLFDPLCHAGATASFWSGHTAQAFTAAGLSCAHHRYVDLYGGGAPDAIACAGIVGLAATTAALRVVGDRHYATDVLAAAVVGFAVGYGVPTLLHYHSRAGDPSGVDSATEALSRGFRFTASGKF
jgi:membrane-associated phospholipid phosphatase